MFRRKEEMPEARVVDAAPAEVTTPAASVFGRTGSQPAATQAAEPQPVFATPRPQAAPAAAAPAAEEPVRTATRPTFETVRQYPERAPLRPTDPVRRADDARGAPAGATPATRQAVDKTAKRILTVGQDTFLKGEISTCDRVIVEGSVEADLKNVQMMEITDSGTFKGSAVVDDAEINGLFEGELTVKNRLIVHAGGKVDGKISYGEIEIQRGGRVRGEMVILETPANPYTQSQTFEEAAAENADAAAAGNKEYAGSISELFESQ